MGFPGSSAGKESSCNAGDPGLIPGSRSSPGEEIGYPVQYFWAFLVARTIKNLPTPVFLPGESPWTKEPGGLQSMRLQTVGPS